MGKDKLISIIIPNYNNDDYLEECIQSVFAQTHDNFELIILDDCSSDNSGEIIRQYASKDKRIISVFNEVNVGVTRNRHNGICEAAGDFVTTLDSDDIYLSEQKLEKELSLVESRNEEGVGNCIAYSGIVLIDKNGSRIGASSLKRKEGSILNDIMSRTCMIPRDFLFTREQYLNAGGFDTNIPIYEDWDLKIRLAKNNLFYYTGIEGIGYRRHGQGLSATSPKRHAWWLSRIFFKNFSLMQSGRMNTAWLFSLFIIGLYKTHLKRKRAR